MSSQRPTLVVIAKDEARCIARCLDSARAVTDRMLVLDTGSSDATPDIARACGAEVHHFEWVDDFSAARNHALDLADSAWNLVVDADEWIEPDSKVDWGSLLSHPRLGLVRLSSIEQSTGMDLLAYSWMPRLLPRGVRYAGRIHEQPVFTGGRIRTGLRVGHDGYMQAQLQKKHGRNRRLIVQALQVEPEDPYLLYQLGREYEGGKDFSAAFGLYQQALNRGESNARYMHSVVVRAVYCGSQARQYEETLRLIDHYGEKYSESPDFHFAAGNAFLDKGLHDPENAMQVWLPKAISAWERCLAIGECPEFEGSVHGRGSFLAASNLRIVTKLKRDMEVRLR